MNNALEYLNLKEHLVEDKKLLLVFLLLAAFTVLSFFYRFIQISYFSIALADSYLLCLLILAAVHCDVSPHHKSIPDSIRFVFPNRTCGIFVFLLLFVILIFGFAGLYIEHGKDFCPPLESRFDAIYFSFTVFGFGIFYPLLDFAKAIIIFQLVSYVLLLIGLLILLVFRLSPSECR
jgi:hypothetical protein